MSKKDTKDLLPVEDGLIESKMSVVGPVDVADVLNPHVGFLDWDYVNNRYDIVCWNTGRVMGTMDFRAPKGTFLIKYDTEDGPYYIHSHMADASAIPNLVSYAKNAVPYNAATAQVICIEIMKGRGLSDICRDKNMPSLVRVSLWRNQHPEFNEMIEVAYQVRGELTRDQIATITEDLDKVVGTELELKVWGKKTDLLKWLAAQDNTRYASKSEVKHSGAVGAIVIETGVRRASENDKEDYSIVDVTPTKDVE